MTTDRRHVRRFHGDRGFRVCARRAGSRRRIGWLEDHRGFFFRIMAGRARPLRWPGRRGARSRKQAQVRAGVRRESRRRAARPYARYREPASGKDHRARRTGVTQPAKAARAEKRRIESEAHRCEGCHASRPDQPRSPLGPPRPRSAPSTSGATSRIAPLSIRIARQISTPYKSRAPSESSPRSDPCEPPPT